jgi:hypothetical protein
MDLVRPNAAVVWQDLPDTELVLLHPTSGIYYGLNATGARVWRALAARPGTIAALASDLAAEFRIDADRAGADLIADLRAADLVGTAPVPATR